MSGGMPSGKAVHFPVLCLKRKAGWFLATRKEFAHDRRCSGPHLVPSAAVNPRST